MKAQWQVKHGAFWWDIPVAISDEIEAKRLAGYAGATYVYNWGFTRNGNYLDPNTAEATTLSRYSIDINTNMQRNLDSESRREVRLIYIDEERGQPPVSSRRAQQRLHPVVICHRLVARGRSLRVLQAPVIRLDTQRSVHLWLAWRRRKHVRA